MAALNLSWITDELAIGGWFSDDRIEELVRDHRVGAIIGFAWHPGDGPN